VQILATEKKHQLETDDLKWLIWPEKIALSLFVTFEKACADYSGWWECHRNNDQGCPPTNGFFSTFRRDAQKISYSHIVFIPLLLSYQTAFLKSTAGLGNRPGKIGKNYIALKRNSFFQNAISLQPSDGFSKFFLLSNSMVTNYTTRKNKSQTKTICRGPSLIRSFLLCAKGICTWLLFGLKKIIAYTIDEKCIILHAHVCC